MLKINQVLYTKDGRRTGNAIIIYYHEATPNTLETWSLKTDYGNTLRLSEKEIFDWYYLEPLYPVPEDYPREPHKHAVEVGGVYND